jgi:hypothetical protein
MSAMVCGDELMAKISIVTLKAWQRKWENFDYENLPKSSYISTPCASTQFVLL